VQNGALRRTDSASSEFRADLDKQIFTSSSPHRADESSQSRQLWGQTFPDGDQVIGNHAETHPAPHSFDAVVAASR
jgi:hypothetical protein